jgi:hypothetical protein
MLLFQSCTTPVLYSRDTPKREVRQNHPPILVLIKTIDDVREIRYPAQHTSIGTIATSASYAQPRLASQEFARSLWKASKEITDVEVGYKTSSPQDFASRHTAGIVVYLDVEIFQYRSGWKANALDFTLSADIEARLRLTTSSGRVVYDEVVNTSLRQSRFWGVSSDQQIAILQDASDNTVQKFLKNRPFGLGQIEQHSAQTIARISYKGFLYKGFLEAPRYKDTVQPNIRPKVKTGTCFAVSNDGGILTDFSVV